VGCGPGSDTATGDLVDVFKHELGPVGAGICETVKRIGGGDSAGGGAGAGEGTGGVAGGGGGSTVDRTPASVARELAEAARALERCGITGLLKKRGCRDSFTALGPGTVVHRLTAPTTRTRATAVVAIASGKRAIPAAGTYPVKIKATSKGRKRLREARKLRATLTVRFTDPRGNVTRRSKPVVLKRTRP
jgi:hypothetical protein